jgi:hypothetical protein
MNEKVAKCLRGSKVLVADGMMIQELGAALGVAG